MESKEYPKIINQYNFVKYLKRTESRATGLYIDNSG